MPENRLLTLGDVWQPSQGIDYMNLLNAQQTMKDAQYRNRLNYITVGQKEFENQILQKKVASYGGPDAYAAALIAEDRAKQQKETTTEQMKLMEPLIKSMVDNGDSAGIQQLFSVYADNPTLGPIIKKMQGMNFNVSGKGEVEVQVNLTDQTRATLTEKAADPTVAQSLADMPPGMIKVKIKGGKIIGAEPVKVEKEPASTEANYRQGLERQMKLDHPEWTPAQIQFEAAKQVRAENAKAAEGRVQFGVTVRGNETDRQRKMRMAEGFGSFTEEEKQVLYATQMKTGQLPKFAFGDQFSYTAYQKGYTQYLLSKGRSPEEMAGIAARMQADFKSQQSSLGNQRKIYDMMNGFVINLNKQLGALDSEYKKLPRTALKLFNIPIVQLRRYVTGSGQEASIKAYLLEVSNEVAKLSTNSSASIRELSSEAQERWAKIHDETLSVNEITKVLKTSYNLANFRLKSNEEALKKTQRAVEEEGISPAGFDSSAALGSPLTPPAGGPSNFQPFDVKLPAGITAEGIAAELEKRRKK